MKDQHLSPKKIRRQEAIIQSMTMQERRNPDIIKGSRKRRIAAGAGVQPVGSARPAGDDGLAPRVERR